MKTWENPWWIEGSIFLTVEGLEIYHSVVFKATHRYVQLFILTADLNLLVPFENSTD